MSVSTTPYDAYLLYHPCRRAIIGLLKVKEGLSVKEIAKKLKIKLELAGFHMLILEKNDFVESNYVYSNPGPKAVKVFKITSKVNDVIEEAEKI